VTTARKTLILDLARMMVKQARMLKNAGLVREARDLARRAIELNSFGHMQMKLQPVRVNRR
jgi:hypothetical protein